MPKARAHSSFCESEGKCWCKQLPDVAELADADDLKSSGETRPGPSPGVGTLRIVDASAELEGIDLTDDEPSRWGVEYPPADHEFKVGDVVLVNARHAPGWVYSGDIGIIRAFTEKGNSAVVFIPTKDAEPNVEVKNLKPAPGVNFPYRLRNSSIDNGPHNRV